MIYYIAAVLGMIACSFSQLLLKRSADSEHRHWLFEFLNFKVVTAYGILFASLMINIWAMSHGVLLKEMGMLETVGYIGVLLISIFVLKERPTKRGLIGGAVCIAGVIFVYL